MFCDLEFIIRVEFRLVCGSVETGSRWLFWGFFFRSGFWGGSVSGALVILTFFVFLVFVLGWKFLAVRVIRIFGTTFKVWVFLSRSVMKCWLAGLGFRF